MNRGSKTREEIAVMKHLRLLLVVGATLLSSTVWAEGGSDRAIERIAARERAEATLVAETVKEIKQLGPTAAGRSEAQPACPPAK
uniref:Uncharacterized protein n=1 Tax=Pseudomonas aeruginosa TaxID=287 RepID=A0A6C0L321_PSEAI|nr:hypothetical protein [Pseudomonas aeruginosa]